MPENGLREQGNWCDLLFLLLLLLWIIDGARVKVPMHRQWHAWFKTHATLKKITLRFFIS